MLFGIQMHTSFSLTTKKKERERRKEKENLTMQDRQLQSTQLPFNIKTICALIKCRMFQPLRVIMKCE
jgi:predicted neuraminidase